MTAEAYADLYGAFVHTYRAPTREGMTVQLRRKTTPHTAPGAPSPHHEGHVPTAHSHSVHLEMPDEPLVVLADPFRVEQITSNLLTNAARYSPPGESIEVSATRLRGRSLIEVRVCDRGLGVADDEKAAIFAPFRTGRHRHAESVGLGLRIARGLAHAHGGDLDVADRPGGGSVFFVRLPAAV